MSHYEKNNIPPLLSPVISFGQCDFNFDYVNTGTNMTAFFTPPAASAIHAELGDGVIGSLLILMVRLFVLHL